MSANTVLDFDRTKLDADGRFMFGKHKGAYLEDVAADDPGYLRWVLDEVDLADSEREDIESVMTSPPRPRVIQESRAPSHPLVCVCGRAKARTSTRCNVCLFNAPLSGVVSAAGSISVGEVDPALPEVTTPPVTPALTLPEIELPDLAPVAPAPDAWTLPSLDAAFDELAPLDAPAATAPAAPAAPAAAPVTGGFPWTQGQREALATIAAWAKGVGPRIISLTGFAGTGKSTLLREACKTLPGVHLAAMTGKAALRLHQLTGAPTSTLHSVLYVPPNEMHGGGLEFSARRPPAMQTLVVDEASLITPKVYLDLEEWAAAGVRILLVGDPFQLPPILSKDEASTWGEEFTVFEKITGSVLTEVVRSSGPILEAATYLRAHKRVQTESQGAYRFARVADPAASAIADYCADPVDHVLVTWRNEIRMGANHAVRARRGHKHPLPERGEPVLIKQNTVGYLNGEVVIADGWRVGPTIGGHGDKEGLKTMWLCTSEGFELLVLVHGNKQFFDGGRPFIDDWFAWRRFCEEPEGRPTDEQGNPVPIPVPVTWGYVQTAHSFQGSEARRVTTFLGAGDSTNKHFRKPSRLPDGTLVPMSIRWLYTALTRAREQTTLYVPA